MAATMSFVLAVSVLSVIVVPASSGLINRNNFNWEAFKERIISRFSNRDTPDSNHDVGQTWPPTFCYDYDCPPYLLNATHEDYEVRDYLDSVWVSTSDSGSTAESSTFMRLFMYILGVDNEEGTKIDMTVPVLMKKGETGMSMSFYIPADDLPAPTPKKDSVELHTMEATRVYVKTFGGWIATEEAWAEQAEELRNALDNDGVAYDSDYYCVGYDSPWKMMNRHNEIWYIAQ